VSERPRLEVLLFSDMGGGLLLWGFWDIVLRVCSFGNWKQGILLAESSHRFR